MFNHIIARFGVPQSLVTDHGSHFCNVMMTELATLLHFKQEHSSPYYPRANGQVESINRVLKTMLQHMVGKYKSNWHIQLFSALWAYRTSSKITTSFTPFQIIYGLEAVLPIECEIPSLKLVVELLPDTSTKEERLLYLSHLEENNREVAMANESHQRRIKTQYNHSVHPRTFSPSDLVLLYDQDHDKLGARKFEPLWHGPYLVTRALQKGSYELVDYEGHALAEPRNGLYLKKYYM